MGVAGYSEEDHEVIGVIFARRRLGRKISGDLYILQVVSKSRQGGRNASQSSGVILAHDKDFEGMDGQRANFNFDRRLSFHSGQKSQMPTDVRGRIALEVRLR